MRVHALLLGSFIFGSGPLAPETPGEDNKTARYQKSFVQTQLSVGC
jgi:hypothetical protein